jgi:hypothetical protein
MLSVLWSDLAAEAHAQLVRPIPFADDIHTRVDLVTVLDRRKAPDDPLLVREVASRGAGIQPTLGEARPKTSTCVLHVEHEPVGRHRIRASAIESRIEYRVGDFRCRPMELDLLRVLNHAQSPEQIVRIA